MDKKFLIKAIVFNTCWLAWIALSVFFGYLIAAHYFADNILTLIPFSLIFMAVGGIAAFFVYRILFKRADKHKNAHTPENVDSSGSQENLDK